MTQGSTDAAGGDAGRYRRIRRLGAGGMATVFLAEDEVLGREVAIKRVHSSSPEDTVKRFRREARLGASVNHPNLVTVFDSATEEDGLVIIMEFVDGESLSERLRRGRMSEGDAFNVLDQIASAIDHLHTHSVVHRDIKPSNILLAKDGTAKLADLGIATATDMTSITASSAVIGSLPYMAPERLHGDPADGASDIFSLGAVAFEVLAGHRVNDAATPEEQIRLASSDAPPNLLEAWPEAPGATARVLAQALSPDPDARPISAEGFVTDLRSSLADGEEERGTATVPMAVVADPTTVAMEPDRPAPERRSSRGRRGAIAALALAAVAIAGIALASGGGGDDPASPVTANGGNAGAKTPATSGGAAEPNAPAAAPHPAPDAPATDPAALNDQGKALIDSGDPESAIPLLRQAVNSYEPGTGDLTYYYALFNLGNALRLAGRPAEAIPYLEQRLSYPDQTSAVQAELDLALQEAGLGGESKPPPEEKGKAKGKDEEKKPKKDG